MNILKQRLSPNLAGKIEGLLVDEAKVNSVAQKIVTVGAGIRGGFDNAQE
jgi:hypothetical protein